MAVILNTPTDPGTAIWSGQTWLVVATDVVTFGALEEGTNSLVVTVPAGLEDLPLILSWAISPASFDMAGGRLWGSITGTSLTIGVYANGTADPGLKVSYAVLKAV